MSKVPLTDPSHPGRQPAPAGRHTGASPLAFNLVWLALLALTVLSYRFADSSLSPALSTPLVLASGSLKALLIGAVFMELWCSSKGLLLGYGLFFAGLGLSLVLLLTL